MIKRKIGATCGTTLLVAAAVVVALRSRRQPALPPDVPVAASPAEVRVKAVERKTETVERGEVVAASGAVAIVCGEDAATGRGNSRLGLSNPGSCRHTTRTGKAGRSPKLALAPT